MDKWDMEKIEGIDRRYRILGGLFLLVTKLETMGNSGRYLGELTTKQWFFLLNLETFFEEPPTIGQLAGRMGTSHQNVKAIANNLVKKGFVKLEKDLRDARALRIVPLDKCRRYGEEQETGNRMFIETLMAGLSSREIEDFDDVLFRLILQAGTMKENM